MSSVTFLGYLFLLSIGILCESVDYNIHGLIKPGWEFVQDLFPENFVQDRDLGVSVAAYHE